MPRQACLDAPGMLHHVIIRGIEKRRIVDDAKAPYLPTLGNHNMVLAILEVETVKSISEKQAEKWKAVSGLGVKLILMIPNDIKVKVTELLWAKGLMDKVSIGTYEISVKMP